MTVSVPNTVEKQLRRIDSRQLDKPTKPDPLSVRLENPDRSDDNENSNQPKTNEKRPLRNRNGSY